MFRKMRRNDKLRSVADTEAILKACTNGVLSVNGDDGYPYGVPVSYVYADGKIYFHGAPAGQKFEAIRRNPKVSFTVVGADNIDRKKVTTVYKSVICFGKARIAETDEEKREILTAIVEKYCHDEIPGGLEYMENVLDKTVAAVIDIDHMTGKGLAD